MTRSISKRKLDFLREELQVWQEEGLIGADSAARIASLYSARSRSFAQTLLCAGAALVGLGAISAVAANWWTIPRLLRTALVLAAYALSMGAASFCEKDSPSGARALRLLAGLIFGGGIFLVAQMYHQGGHWSTAFGWWALGLIPAARLFRDAWQMYLLQAVSLFYVGGQGMFFWGRMPDLAPFRGDVLPGALLLVLWWLWRQTLGNLRAFNFNVQLTILFLFTRLLWYFSLTEALLASFAAGLALTAWPRADAAAGWRASLSRWGILITGIAGVALSVPEVWYDFPYLRVVDGTAAQELNALRLAANGAAALTAAVMGWRLYRGSRLGGAFLALLVLRYFVDHFFGFMPKAAAFSGLGLLCLLAGFWWERSARRKKTKRDKEGDVHETL